MLNHGFFLSFFKFLGLMYILNELENSRLKCRLLCFKLLLDVPADQPEISRFFIYQYGCIEQFLSSVHSTWYVLAFPAGRDNETFRDNGTS